MTEHWATVALDDLTSKIGSGATPRGGSKSYHATGVPLIRSMNVHFDGLRREGLVHLSADQARQLNNVTVEAGDVLLNITGASIGRVATAPSEIAGARVNQHVAIIRPVSGVDSQFLRLFFASPASQRWILGENYGVTRPALTKLNRAGFAGGCFV